MALRASFKSSWKGPNIALLGDDIQKLDFTVYALQYM